MEVQAPVLPKVRPKDVSILQQRQRYPFNTDEYYLMIEAGVFGEDDRVELLEGEIVVAGNSSKFQ